MTNLEKAKDLYHKVGMEESMLSALCEMAKWKDDKFETILANVKFSLEKYGIKGVDEFVNCMKKQWEE